MEEPNTINKNCNSVIIFVTEQGVSIKELTATNNKPTFIDFSNKKLLYRKNNSSSRKEAIARAVGLKHNQPIEILDATAGMGEDSFILAALGANMTMLERNPLIHLMLEDALERARSNINLTKIISRMRLINHDTITFLNNTEIQADVIYMDPMFPDKNKSALNKKEMRLFRILAGDDSDIGLLFTNALTHAKKRVVVKRPLRAPYVNDIKPHFDILGKSSRFDVYIVEHSQIINNKSTHTNTLIP